MTNIENVTNKDKLRYTTISMIKTSIGSVEPPTNKKMYALCHLAANVKC